MKKSVRNLNKENYTYYRDLKRKMFKLDNLNARDNKTLAMVNKLYKEVISWNLEFPKCKISLEHFTNYQIRVGIQRFNMYCKGFSVTGTQLQQFRTVECKRRLEVDNNKAQIFFTK